MDVRNIVLVGRSGAGKTTLVEALAGRPVLAATPTARLDATVVEHRGTRLTLLDTPGDPELQGALHAGLRAADAVLFVVSTIGGLDAVTAQLWARCAAHGRPRLVALTQLDRPGSDVDEAVALCQRLLQEDVLPLALPMHDDDGAVAGLLTLLDLTVIEPTGRRPADPEHRTLVTGLRAELVEAVLADSDDDALVQAWIGGELDGDLAGDLPEVAERGKHGPGPRGEAQTDAGRRNERHARGQGSDRGHRSPLWAALHQAVRRGALAPAAVVGAVDGVGVPELLDLLVDALPSPAEAPCPDVRHSDGSPAAPLEPDLAGPAVAEVVRGGAPSLVRVWSGPGAGTIEQRDQHLTVGAVLADGLLLAGWDLPEPAHAVGVEGDLSSLAARVEQDPTLDLHTDPDTGQRLLLSLGARHTEVALAGLEVRTSAVVAPTRTVDGTAQQRWEEIVVTVPAAFVRSVRSDLAGRGARLAAPEPTDPAPVDPEPFDPEPFDPEAFDPEPFDQVIVCASLPSAALDGYPTALGLLTQGTGRLTRRPGAWVSTR